LKEGVDTSNNIEVVKVYPVILEFGKERPKDKLEAKFSIYH
jgi:hypothetical protein